MSSDPSSSAVNKAWRIAEMQDLDDDLDAIREVSSDANGTVIRVLLEDAESEADQVGFQATKPPGQLNDTMFTKRLKNGMRELNDILAGKQPTQSNTADTPDEDPRESSTTEQTEPSDSVESDSTVSQVAEADLTVELAITNESIEEIRSVLSDELEDAPRTERVDEIDERLTSLEERLSLLGSVADDDDNIRFS